MRADSLRCSDSPPPWQPRAGGALDWRKYVALLVIALGWPMLALGASTLSPFVGEFAVFENDKRIGTAKLSVRADGRRYVFTTETEGDRGLAGFLGAAIRERSVLERIDGALRSVDYDYKQDVAFRSRERSIRFDYANLVAIEKDRKNQSQYRLPSHALDRHAVVLALAEQLARRTSAKGKLRVVVAHKGEASQWEFQRLGSESITTAEGAVQAIKLERLRANKDRVTRSWHAERWHYLPVRIEQVEPDGERYRMELLRWLQVPAASPVNRSP